MGHNDIIILFIKTHLVVQESVLLLKWCNLDNMTFWPHLSQLSRVFKTVAFFNVKCHFAYIMNIHKVQKIIYIQEI